MSKSLAAILSRTFTLSLVRSAIVLTLCLGIGYTEKRDPSAYLSSIVIAYLALTAITSGMALRWELRKDIDRAAELYARAMGHLFVAWSGHIVSVFFGKPFLMI